MVKLSVLFRLFILVLDREVELKLLNLIFLFVLKLRFGMINIWNLFLIVIFILLFFSLNKVFLLNVIGLMIRLLIEIVFFKKG